MLRVLLLASALALVWLFVSVFLDSSSAHAADVGSAVDAAEVVPAPVADSVLPEPVPVAPVDPLPVAEQVIGSVRPAEVVHPVEDAAPAVVEVVPAPVVETVAQLAPAVAPRLPDAARAVAAVVDLVLPSLDALVSAAPVDDVAVDLPSAPAAGDARASLALETTPAALRATGETDGGMTAAAAINAVVAPSPVPDPASEPNEPATVPAGGGEAHSGPWAVVDASEMGSVYVLAAGAVSSVNPSSFAGEDPPTTPD